MGILDKAQQWLLNFGKELAPVDPAVFGDPLALKTKWTPLSPGGASFATHRLRETDPGRLELKKSVGSFFFGATFVLVGLGTVAAGALDGPWFLMVLGGVFAAAGTWFGWPTSQVFDGNSRQISLRTGPLSFSAIHAVQIVKEHVRRNKKSYWSYELNLVLKDGERVNVVDHADLPRIQSESQMLKTLLGCKLWDATLPVETKTARQP
jgi:hypothetical protein